MKASEARENMIKCIQSEIAGKIDTAIRSGCAMTTFQFFDSIDQEVTAQIEKWLKSDGYSVARQDAYRQFTISW